MEKLNEANVATIAAFLKGAKLSKFMESVKIINDSLSQGAWIKMGKVKAFSGLTKLCVPPDDRTDFELNDVRRFVVNDVYSLLYYGRWSVDEVPEKPEYYKGKNYPKTDMEVFQIGLKTLRELGPLKVSDEVALAWLLLIKESDKAASFLDTARPLPVITPIGLSPKVKKTLTECNLDLDLSSIRMANLDYEMVPAMKYDEKTEELVPVLDRNGKRVIVRRYFVKWTEGIIHHQSRFAAGGSHCEACGRAIPSGWFVPIEAFDKKKKQLISMWLGCDCARNIFGVKDEGIKQGTES